MGQPFSIIWLHGEALRPHGWAGAEVRPASDPAWVRAQCCAERVDAVVCDSDALDEPAVALLAHLRQRHPAVLRVVLVDDELVPLWQSTGHQIADVVIARLEPGDVVSMVKYLAGRTAAATRPRATPLQ